jgi:signal transduction histidine kinase
VALHRGIAVIDPARLAHEAAPSIVHIESVAADGSPLTASAALSIPAARRRVAFSFIGLSLTVPERVRFRYRLDGFDHDWSPPVSAREAAYTNLSPGPYRFRVMASNSAGLWNSQEANLVFEVTPAFWQTLWFRFSALLLCALCAAAAYRLHLRQVTRQLNLRFEERLAERTRIAQDLHDTLLQGLLSASMQLHVAVEDVPLESAARPQLARVLQLIQRVVEEGRNAVRGLRSTPGPVDDLEAALSRLTAELMVPPSVKFRVIVEGRSRGLNPLIRDEVYSIGREALVNAFRHSGGDAVEAELEFDHNQLRLIVRDSGCGIDPEILRSGRDGHWGLLGMRERAERIGAKLKVWSRAAAGTEVELIVPGHIAFPRKSAPRGWKNILRRSLTHE